jgi:hypothetical protein
VQQVPPIFHLRLYQGAVVAHALIAQRGINHRLHINRRGLINHIYLIIHIGDMRSGANYAD